MSIETSRTRSSKWRQGLELAALVMMIVASAMLIYAVSRQQTTGQAKARDASGATLPLPHEPISLIGAETKGDAKAGAVLIIFSDFQCPFCARFATETLPEIEQRYVGTGKVKLAFRHLPLDRIHQFARSAAMASWCAGRQGKFWEMHDRLFVNQARLDEASISGYARSLGLEDGSFRECASSGPAAEQVARDERIAREFGLSGTPAFLLGEALPDGTVRASKWLTGSRPAADFEDELEKLVNKR